MVLLKESSINELEMWIEDDTPKENKMKCYSCKKPLRFWQKGFIIGTTFVHEKCYDKDAVSGKSFNTATLLKTKTEVNHD